jgi:threonine/homoserine/homoserine lactone efflux protein
VLTFYQIISFLSVSVLLTLTPGPDNLSVLAISLSKGSRQGFLFGLGCALGCIFHTILVLAGVSAIIISSPNLFSFLKILGGLYLIYLGIQMLIKNNFINLDGQGASTESLLSKTFFKGVLASAINPKVGLFFISFLPQFVISSQGEIIHQLALLSGIFILQAILIFGLIAYFAGLISDMFKRYQNASVWLDRLAGLFLGMLGLHILMG